MHTPYEIYKQLHPNQFSDSEVIKASKFDRDFFDYYLSNITSRGDEKKFEIFCRRIAEKEICPNLLPQTGPTGGGDSKADSETYPVSDQLPIMWYSGIGIEALKDRWAFAFSAKQKWKAKLYSDVEKIVEVNNQNGRGYTKIFFMSNQYISDRKRAEAEDELRRKHSIDIRVLDRSWLIEKVFSKNHIKIVAECFELSDTFVDDIKKGPGDYSKELNLHEIEDTLRNYDSALPKISMIPLALEAAYISRSLELPKDITIAKFERAFKIIEEFGFPIHKTECIYEWAWTLYWWYEDYSHFYIKYCEFEALALSDDNIYEIERLANLWMNLRSYSLMDKQYIDIKPHSTRLLEALNKYINDASKPHASFEARAIKLNISLLISEDINEVDIDEIVDQYIELVNDSDNHLDFSLSKLVKMVTRMPFLEDCERFEELFELITVKLAERKQEVTRADLLITRAMKVAEDKPVSAISYLGRALIDLYKEESKHKLILSLSCIASCFETIGCLWAARNYNLYVFALCFTQYTKYGEIHPALVTSSSSIKMLELQLGRVGYALSSHEWSIISKNLYFTEVSKSNIDDNDELFEPILAIAIMKTPYEKLDRIGFLVDVLKRHDLYIAEVALKYMLGYYDEEWQSHYDNSIPEFEQSMDQLYDQPAREQILYSTWYGIEDNAIMQTNLLGCKIEIESDNKFVCLELGATILAMLEGFFSTGIQKRILVQKASIKIEIQYSHEKGFIISEDNNCLENADIVIKCSEYNKDDIASEQVILSDFLLELFPKVLAKMVYFNTSKESLEELIKEERAFDRSFTFVNSIFYPAQVLGDDYGISSYSERFVNQQSAEFPLIRQQPVCFNIQTEHEPSQLHENRKLKIIYDALPPNLNFEKIKHKEMAIESIIEVPLWDEARWHGVSFMAAQNNTASPVLGLLFKNNIPAEQIFINLRNRFGSVDVNNEIQIGIIKGINREHPCHYRVIITSNLKHAESQDQFKLVQWMSRLHTMEATTLTHLQTFEEAIKRNSYFYFLLSTIEGGQAEPVWTSAIKKSIESVTICNAWEVEEDSYLLSGVLPTDTPIIPPGVVDAPIIKAIENKSRFFSQKIGRNDPCPCGSGKKYKKCCLDKGIY